MNLNLISFTGVFSALLLSSSSLFAQPDEGTHNWVVSNLGDQINSEYHDSWSTVNEDELTLYFGSNRPGGFDQYNPEDDWGRSAEGTETSYDIYVSHRDSLDAPWGKPILLPAPVNSEFNDHSAAESPDGHYLFWASSRPGGCGSLDLYVSYREDVTDDAAWGEPKNLGCEKDGGPNTAAIESCPIFHVDEKTDEVKIYYTGSSTPNPMTLDYKMTVFDADSMTAGEAKTINISTDYLDGHIDPRYGYVWAAMPESLGGSDIWISDRTGHPDEWKPPVNLGSTINTEFEEQLPSPAAEGNKIYFPSNRPGGYGGMDIYQAVKEHSGAHELALSEEQ